MNCVVNLFGEREKREKRRDLRHWFQPKITIRMFFNQSHTNGQLCFEMCAYLFFSFALRTLIRLFPKNVHVGFFSLFSLSSPRHTHTHQKHLFVWGRQNAYESKLWREIREKLTILITGSRENALGNNLLRPNKLRKMNARQTFSSSFALYHISCYILVEIFPKYHIPIADTHFHFAFIFFSTPPPTSGFLRWNWLELVEICITNPYTPFRNCLKPIEIVHFSSSSSSFFANNYPCHK